METRGQKFLLTAAIAGLLAGAGNGVLATNASAESTDGVHCYGINACKGTGECGGKTHSCAGQNECSGQAWIKLPKDKCLKIEGGRLTEAEEE